MTKRKVRKDKITFTQKDLKQIETMAGLGFTQQELCSVLGLSIDTLKSRMKEDDNDLSAVFTKGKVNALSKVAKKAYTLAISGNTSMIKYFLSCQRGWTEKVQINTLEEPETSSARKYSLDDITSVLNIEEYEELKKHHEHLMRIKNIAIERIKIKEESKH